MPRAGGRPDHELAAEVEDVGDAVDASGIGARGAGAGVAVPSLPYLRHCRTCRRGNVHLCEALRRMTFQTPDVVALCKRGTLLDAGKVAPASTLLVRMERVAQRAAQPERGDAAGEAAADARHGPPT